MIALERGTQRRLLPGARVIPLIALLAVALGGRAAQAQDAATIDKLVQLNKKAMDDYDTADFDTAKKALLDAEKIGKRSGLESHPVMARTYIHLGALYLIGYKDRAKAQHYFGKALDIQPDINLDRSLTSSAVRDLFAQVKEQSQQGAGSAGETPPEEAAPPPRKGAGKRGRGPDLTMPEVEPAPETTIRSGRSARGEEPADDSGGSEPDLPAKVTALECPYPDDTPPLKKVTLRCAAAASLGVANMNLHYKGYGMRDYETIQMTKSPKGWFQATVPKKRVDGKSLQFYFEGLDAGDNPVVSNGRAQSPNVMLIVERGNRVARAGGVEENPLEEQNVIGAPRLKLGSREDDSEVGVDKRFGNRRFWIGLGLGTSMMYAINGQPESRVRGTLINGGLNPNFNMDHDVTIQGAGWGRIGQLAPEIGFQINANWAISVEGRHQWILQSKTVASYTASGAHAVLAKVIRYTKQQRMRGFAALAFGGGEGARMGILSDPQNDQLWDTVLIGQLLVGGTGGLTYEISKRVSWVAELNALFGTPKKGFVFDVNTGFQMNFGDTSGAAEAAAEKKKHSVSSSVDDETPQD